MYKFNATQFLAQQRQAALNMEQLEARILAKARANGVEAVVLQDEILLKGLKAEEVLKEAKEFYSE